MNVQFVFYGSKISKLPLSYAKLAGPIKFADLIIIKTRRHCIVNSRFYNHPFPLAVGVKLRCVHALDRGYPG